jgi:hypothetical protein
MTTATVTETRHNANPVGRVELARYTAPAGNRILYGQRIDGVVRFLPDEPVVLDGAARATLDGRERPDAAGQNRLDDRPGGETAQQSDPELRGRTGERVELARYVVSSGERALCGQRVLGVVRVTDVPLDAGGRSYLVERGLEEEGLNANAALHALIVDYLRHAEIRDAVPIAEVVF